jgi:hypothetical protein
MLVLFARSDARTYTARWTWASKKCILLGKIKDGPNVKIGSRNLNQEIVKERHDKTYHGASAGSFADAAIFPGVGVVATLWDAVREERHVFLL